MADSMRAEAAEGKTLPTIDYSSATMVEKLTEAIDYDSLTRGKLCPICVAALTIAGHTRADEHLARCGPRCAW